MYGKELLTLSGTSVAAPAVAGAVLCRDRGDPRHIRSLAPHHHHLRPLGSGRRRLRVGRPSRRPLRRPLGHLHDRFVEVERRRIPRRDVERERQARIILGTAETEISEKFAKASEVYQDNPVALHLRAMNMLYEGLKEKGALMLIPKSHKQGVLAALGRPHATPADVVTRRRATARRPLPHRRGH